MVTVRHTAAVLLLVSSSWIGGAGTPAWAGPSATAIVSGVTRDALGQPLAGVEVLVLSDARSGTALVDAISDEKGRFVLGALTPGVYRVAAIKSGYIAALGRVNTLIRSSVDLVLRPVPRPGEPGSENVTDDLSWALRVPPRSILRQVDAASLLDTQGTGGARAFAARVQDSVRGQVDHVVAMGSWRPAGGGTDSSLQGMETRMRLEGPIGDRGAIQVQGRRAGLDSSAQASSASVSRDAADVNLDVSYDTSDDANLAMTAFYSRGDLEVGGPHPGPKGGASQGQRSWGYDASWKKQVDGSSRVALQVGYHDANLDLPDTTPATTEAGVRDGSNRAIGAEGSYENLVGDGHLITVGVRAQRMMLASPDARVGGLVGSFPIEGADGWSVLMDAADRWSPSSSWAVTYGLAVRQDFDGPMATVLTPRAGGSFTSAHVKARAELSYLAATNLGDSTSRAVAASSSPLGYEIEIETPLNATVSVRGSAAYVPLRADRWSTDVVSGGLTGVYVTDGIASDRSVALAIERRGATATVTLHLARGRADGALAPAFGGDVPIVVLGERTLVYSAARLDAKLPRSGSTFSLEYRSMREPATVGVDPWSGGSLRTVDLQFAQDLVRMAGGRATCRLIVVARTAIDPPADAGVSDELQARRFAAINKRVGAGVSLSF
jgi:Carboxypeptidase regulatory-like domain